jgi:polysaccharide pyruvyl transferase WcaK-like protein
MLIASGGGQLDDYWGGTWGHPYGLFKWAIISRLTGTKFVILSVGTCSLDSKLSKFFIKQALRQASYRSYRDQTSKDLLKSMAFTNSDPVFPDLVFSHFMAQGKEPSSNGIERVVGISPIAFLSQYGWPKKNLDFFMEYINKLIIFVAWLIEERYSILFFATAAHDKPVLDLMIAKLEKKFNSSLAAQVSRPDIETIADLFKWLPNVGFVVASRLHGILLSHLINKPVLAISYDRKVRTYMEDIGQEEYCLDIHDFHPNDLKNRFSSLEAHAACLRERIRAAVANYQCMLDLQYDQVLQKPCKLVSIQPTP